ncbi:MAG: hypothetical protein DHS20C18_23980 [Saprospiraceae bacterium]|nr:MAG: hypothetical protein DHS20C18_23980 [Saprospiraceae bacterium]
MQKLLLLLFLFGINLGLVAQTAFIDSLTQELTIASNDSNKILLLNILSTELRGVDVGLAKGYARQAIQLSEKIGFPKGLKKAYYNLAAGHYFSTAFDSMQLYSEKTISVCNEKEDFILLNSTYGLMATAAFDQGNYNEAVKYNTLAIKVAENNEDWEGVAFSCVTQGNVQWKLENHDLAREYYQKAFDEFKKINNPYGMANALSNLGNVTKDSTQRMDYHLQARAIYEDQGSIYGISTIDNNIGSFYQTRGDYPQAIIYYKRALEAVEDSDYQEKKVQFYTNLGSVYGKMGQLEVAMTWFEKAESLAKEIGVKSLLKDTYTYMEETFSKQGNYALAYEYLQKYTILQDSLFKEDLAHGIAESDARYKNAEQARTLAQTELQLIRQRNARNIILFAAALAILALIFGLLWLRNRTRLRRKEALMERAEAEKLRELDRVKSNFFANISHEFRTPLTLIQGPLKEMSQNRFKGDLQKYYRIMLRNSERLLNLVNQLLDLSKLESGREQLEIEKGNVGQFINAIANAFESMAARKQIDYQIQISPELEAAYFDRDKLEKIMTNLLSNAFKFTNEEGQITFIVKRDEHNQLLMQLKDNGIGIPADLQEHIFERFYSNKHHDGEMDSSGIGLALTKELVELHGGRIEVKSEENQGTTFSVYLPIGTSLLEKGELLTRPVATLPGINAAIPEEVFVGETKETNATGFKSKELVLVVDDNDDVRAYIMDQLRDRYRLLEARNGKEGLEIAKESIPGLILSDVMMPEMDGIEFCNQLRKLETTSHIPVIILTAKADREDKLQGLETGAEDYLTKPFDAEELKLKVRNLLEQREKWRTRFSNVVTFKPQEMAVTSVDEVFLNRIAAIIEENMDEELFGVPELAQAVSLSRSQLHRKLKALSDKAPSQIIKDMRLQRAKELLEKGAGNASEVAFMVGFNSLAYFSKCFKDAYGYSPSEVSVG